MRDEVLLTLARKAETIGRVDTRQPLALSHSFEQAGSLGGVKSSEHQLQVNTEISNGSYAEASYILKANPFLLTNM